MSLQIFFIQESLSIYLFLKFDLDHYDLHLNLFCENIKDHKISHEKEPKKGDLSKSE